MVSWLLRPLIRCYNPAKLPDKLQLICFLNSTNRIAAELLPKLHSSHQTERCDSPNLLVDLRPAPVFEEYFSSHPLSDRRHCDSVCYVKRSTDSKDSAVAKRLQTHVAWSRMILPPPKKWAGIFVTRSDSPDRRDGFKSQKSFCVSLTSSSYSQGTLRSAWITLRVSCIFISYQRDNTQTQRKTRTRLRTMSSLDWKEAVNDIYSLPCGIGFTVGQELVTVSSTWQRYHHVSSAYWLSRKKTVVQGIINVLSYYNFVLSITSKPSKFDARQRSQIGMMMHFEVNLQIHFTAPISYQWSF